MYIPLSLLMALPIAAPMYTHWEKALLFLFGSASGATDPLLGKDISFYLLSLPVHVLIRKKYWLPSSSCWWGCCSSTGTKVACWPFRIGRCRAGPACTSAWWPWRQWPCICWGFLLDRYDLLSKRSICRSFSVRATSNAHRSADDLAVCIFSCSHRLSLVVCFNRKAGWKLSVVVGVLFVLSVMGKNADFSTTWCANMSSYPTRSPGSGRFIDANIRSTLAAYRTRRRPDPGLQDPIATRFRCRRPGTGAPPAEHSRLGPRDAGRRLQRSSRAFGTYYSFPTIDVDRYTVEGSYRQVYLGAREIQFSKLPNLRRIGSTSTCSTPTDRGW